MTFYKDEHYQVSIVKILDRGAVISIPGCEKTMFIHISAISKRFVKNISDFIQVGETYDAVCTDQDRPSFSLQHLDLKPKTPESVPDFGIRKQAAPQTLDEMIARANASLADKQKSARVPMSQPHTRKKRKRGVTDYD